MDNLGVIIQGGAVGVAVFCLLILAYLIKLVLKLITDYLKLIGDYMNRNTKAMVENAESNRALCDLIKDRLK